MSACNVLGASADVEPETLLAAGIRKSAVLGGTEFVILSLRLCEDALHDLVVQNVRDICVLEDIAHSLPMSRIGILQAQGMSWDSRRAQQPAQPFPIP
jgi:hypothetical protein